MSRCRIVFITGTDTGVGKTVLTGLLLATLRRQRTKALAIKPFCSGRRSDPVLLRALQDEELSLAEINPFYFSEPVAPLVAARKNRLSIPLDKVLTYVREMALKCDCLLVEGAGGLLAPLGEGYSALELIAHMRPIVAVAARNKLGALNHVLLTVSALRRARITKIRVALIDAAEMDQASNTNEGILRELLGGTPLFRVPFLGRRARTAEGIRVAGKSLARSLGRIAGPGGK